MVLFFYPDLLPPLNTERGIPVRPAQAERIKTRSGGREEPLAMRSVRINHGLAAQDILTFQLNFPHRLLAGKHCGPPLAPPGDAIMT